MASQKDGLYLEEEMTKWGRTARGRYLLRCIDCACLAGYSEDPPDSNARYRCIYCEEHRSRLAYKQEELDSEWELESEDDWN